MTPGTVEVSRLIRRDLKGWTNYQVQPVVGRKMDANESPFPMDAALRKTLADWILHEENLRLYPDTDSVRLRETVAARYGVKKEQVICGVGSDQLIDCLIRVFLEPGETVLVPSPSFSMYETAAVINHARAASFPLTEETDFAFSAETVIEAVSRVRPKILFLCTPNNPTGTMLKREDLVRILDSADCIVALDQAYGEFAGDDFLDLTRSYPNLVSLRTFSKAYGLAGLRVGYAIGSEDLIAALDTVRAPYNLNTFSQIAAACVLERPEYAEHIRWIIEERERLYASLAALTGKKGFYCFPSSANFLFMRMNVPDPGEKLLAKGLLVRRYAGAQRGYIRVSIADRETNDRFLGALKELLEEGEYNE